MLKKFLLDKINGSKNALFFLSGAPTHHSFTFNLWFLYELMHRVLFSKTVSRIFHFWFRFVFIKVYIFLMDSMTLKPHNSFQSWNDRKATYSLAPRSLVFKLQQQVLKFNDICVSWSYPKTNLETNFLNFENRSFENVSFSE